MADVGAGRGAAELAKLGFVNERGAMFSTSSMQSIVESYQAASAARRFTPRPIERPAR
jgi:hypothetical protein